jgi:hypothetical protein
MFVTIFGVVIFILGLLFIIFTEWFVQNFGRIEWAEAKLGAEGGTRIFYKLLGLILIFFGMLMILGLFGGLVMWIFSPLMPKS